MTDNTCHPLLFGREGVYTLAANPWYTLGANRWCIIAREVTPRDERSLRACP